MPGKREVAAEADECCGYAADCRNDKEYYYAVILCIQHNLNFFPVHGYECIMCFHRDDKDSTDLDNTYNQQHKGIAGLVVLNTFRREKRYQHEEQIVND